MSRARPSMRLVSAEEMRTLDRLTIERYGTPGHVLMERAGTGATRVLLEQFPFVRRRGRRVLVVAGKGNNGGDGLVIARLLRRRRIAVAVVLLARAGEVTGDAAGNLAAYRRGRGRIEEVAASSDIDRLAQAVARADLIVDAIFGTGLGTAVHGLQAEAIEMINSAGVPVFAVDLPSGLDADTGQPLGACVQAEATATFAFAKVGHVLHPGARLSGTVAVVDIGIAPQALAERPATVELLEPAAVARLVPGRAPDAHKGDGGHVLVVAGSFGKLGAAQLVSRAASRAGAGLVTLVGPASLYGVFAAGAVEAMTETLPDVDGGMQLDERRLHRLVADKTAVVVGPGIGTHDGARQIVAWIVRHARVPVVLDADALNCVATDPDVLTRAHAPLLLTPHPGEMARLIGETTDSVQRDRVGTARRFASARRCTLVLKGARTVIADAGGMVWINPTGNPGMASGGMGDVLAGILAGLLAQRLEPTEAARLGAYLHGAVADAIAARDGEIGLLASDIVDGLPQGMRRLRDNLDG